MKLDGSATMFLRMPMSAFSLPVQGNCVVEGKVVKLNFAFTTIEFELPHPPVKDEDQKDVKIRSVTGGTLWVNVHYIKELSCFTGEVKTEDSHLLAAIFDFHAKDSPLRKLPHPHELKR